jgi:protease IV
MMFAPLNRSRVAVVEMYGPIGGAIRSRQFAPMLKALREDKQVKAVVLDIDSPGGAAGEADYIYGDVREIAARKPVVAFVRGTGASGAYYIACAAQQIIAQRSSIVGSIGVIMVRPQVQELLEKIGIKVSVIATGPLKGSGLPFREESDLERDNNGALISAFFERFIGVVAEGRKVSRERAREWATGEVFWGSQALEQGLVDEVGDLERAIALAARLGNAPEKSAVTVRPSVPLMQRLMRGLATSAVGAIRNEAERLFASRIEYR